MTETVTQTNEKESQDVSRFRQFSSRLRQRITPSLNGNNGRPRRLRYAHIIGWGMYVPEEIRTNADIAQLVAPKRWRLPAKH